MVGSLCYFFFCPEYMYIYIYIYCHIDLSNPTRILFDVYVAQLDLRNSSILVVGAGGLGASCLLYLGGAGVGRLGIVDHDTVDTSNLHRQVIHNEARQGMSKAQSAALSVRL